MSDEVVKRQCWRCGDMVDVDELYTVDFTTYGGDHMTEECCASCVNFGGDSDKEVTA